MIFKGRPKGEHRSAPHKGLSFDAAETRPTHDTQHPTSATVSVAHLRQALPRPLVFAYGVFDWLHAGHVACLETARRQGASLVVGLRGDLSASRFYKGDGRRVNAASDRARVVGALSAVSAVVMFDEDKPLALICALRPDVLVTAGCPRETTHWPEAALMAEWGGHALIVPRVPDHSSSALLARARTQVLLVPHAGQPSHDRQPTATS